MNQVGKLIPSYSANIDSCIICGEVPLFFEVNDIGFYLSHIGFFYHISNWDLVQCDYTFFSTKQAQTYMIILHALASWEGMGYPVISEGINVSDCTG